MITEFTMKNISEQIETDNSADITVQNWRTEHMLGNDMPQSVTGTPDIHGKWNQRIGSPKSTWGKLTRSRLPGGRVRP
jgi:hypothetical protein